METHLVLPWIVLTLISIITRVGPLFAAKWLKNKSWMNKMNDELPCMILVLLVFHEAQGKIAAGNGSLLAITSGIAATLFMHHWKSHTLLSIASGVCTYFVFSDASLAQIKNIFYHWPLINGG